MKPIAICVGHSRLINGRPEGGAVSVGGVAEWTYNIGLAAGIRDRLAVHRVNAIIISEYTGDGYTTAQRWLANQIRLLGCQLAIELHFNSADTSAANGHEWLYWSTSPKGKALAESLHASMCLAVTSIKSRGVKPKTSGDRGAEFLKLPPCPCVIAETGFGSNSNDWGVLANSKGDVARAIADGILDYLA